MIIADRIGRAVGGGTRRELTVGTAGTIAMNLTTTGLGFLIVLVLSRFLGASGYGAYAFALAWALFLSSVAGLGLSPLIVREVARAKSDGRWATLRGVLRWSSTAVLVASALLVCVAATIGAAFLDEELLGPYLVGLLLVLPNALTMVRQSSMQGLGRVVLARAPETLVAPLIFLVLVLAVGLAAEDELTAGRALGLQLLGALVAFAVGVALLARTVPPEARRVSPVSDHVAWRRSAVVLFLLGVLLAAQGQIGTILLGAMSDPVDTGIFAVALRISLLVGFVSIAANYALMPVAARLFSSGDIARLAATVTRSARVLFLCSASIAVVLLILSDFAMRLFGDDFGSGKDALRILIAGEIARASLGLGGLSLVMTGHEADLARGVFAGLVVYVTLAVGLIPQYGVEGAAAAAATGTVSSSLVLALLARRRLGFSGTVFSFSPRP
ncbi:MAG: oligosaccharide flippase family protein [Actinobacteria bacterium]|nr:oligosaccharide flippase family protein [Actinomycetota bacterium]